MPSACANPYHRFQTHYPHRRRTFHLRKRLPPGSCSLPQRVLLHRRCLPARRRPLSHLQQGIPDPRFLLQFLILLYPLLKSPLILFPCRLHQWFLLLTRNLLSLHPQQWSLLPMRNLFSPHPPQWPLLPMRNLFSPHPSQQFLPSTRNLFPPHPQQQYPLPRSLLPQKLFLLPMLRSHLRGSIPTQQE